MTLYHNNTESHTSLTLHVHMHNKDPLLANLLLACFLTFLWLCATSTYILSNILENSLRMHLKTVKKVDYVGGGLQNSHG